MTSRLTFTRAQRTPAFVLSVFLLAAALTASVSAPAQAATTFLDIVYSSGGNIWTQRADGTKTQLTQNIDPSGGDAHPLDVSPDGLWITYEAKIPGTVHSAIWVMGVDGANPRQLTSPPTDLTTDGLPRWSPDGKRIVFNRFVSSPLSGATTSDLYLLDVSNGTATAATTSHAVLGTAAWSPDSQRLAYGEGGVGLSIVGIDGSGKHLVSLQAPEYPNYPEWSPDGSTIYFVSASVSGIFSYTSTDQFTSTLGTAPRNLFPSPYYQYSNPRVTPDRKSLGFTRNNDIYTLSLVDGTVSPQPLQLIDGFSFIPAKAASNSPAFKVQVDSSAVGNVFGSVPTIKVLESKVLPYPSAACGGGWEVSTTNKTDLALHIPTNGNVTGTRVDYGKVAGGYLLPGGTALYCVDFTRLNQIFSVLYDVNDAYARTMDAGLLLLNAVSLPAGASPELLNFEIAIASIPEISQLGACITSRNPSCAATTVQKLLADQQSMKALNEALIQYGVDTGITLVEQNLDKLIQKKLSNIVATGLFVIRYGGQSFLSTAGYVSFETAPLP